MLEFCFEYYLNSALFASSWKRNFLRLCIKCCKNLTCSKRSDWNFSLWTKTRSFHSKAQGTRDSANVKTYSYICVWHEVEVNSYEFALSEQWTKHSTFKLEKLILALSLENKQVLLSLRTGACIIRDNEPPVQHFSKRTVRQIKALLLEHPLYFLHLTCETFFYYRT
jgi:hypothetical protein